jgi:hypothetical protein
VNRDNVLFLSIGLLAGFLVGYIAHETMSAVQPPRLATGVVSAAGEPHPPVPAEGGGPQVEDINRLKQIVESEPENRQALLTLANMNFDIGNWARAEELYQRYLTLDPGNPDVLTDLGIAVRSQGDFTRALELFGQAKEIRPDHWQAVFNEIVVLAFDLSDFTAADERIEILRRLAPGNPDVDRLVQEVERLRTGV